MKSISYYLTLWVIRLKGVKKNFSVDPINYKRLRKKDLHEPVKNKLRPNNLNRFSVFNTLITEIRPRHSGEHLVIFCHGGAFVYGPVQYHWDAARKIANSTGCTVWMTDYPKAPENKIQTISDNIDEVYREALKKFPGKILLVGDSVGGTLIISLVQRLIQQENGLPSLVITISPVVDASMENPAIATLDRLDPILSLSGVKSAKKMCAGSTPLRDVSLSPLNGKFEGFPKTLLFLAEHDITFPDQKFLVQKMQRAGVELKVIEGKQMPHIWPILPVMKEGKTAFKQAIKEIIEVLEQPEVKQL